eukprot:9988095-Prorocentrum_lima.AAC.1
MSVSPKPQEVEPREEQSNNLAPPVPQQAARLSRLKPNAAPRGAIEHAASRPQPSSQAGCKPPCTRRCRMTLLLQRRR